MNAIALTLNGLPTRLETRGDESILESLRERCGLTGARQTCGIGICGACTVLVGGLPVSGCLTLTATLEGQDVLTIEGLERDGQLDPVQQAFIDEMGFQCSYCTPGMILTTKALLAENPNPSDVEAREYLSGNLCRCGSYEQILAAVQRASQALAAQVLREHHDQ
jgi:aerobic carbon-monoxide dehydrogenase small subunit